MRTSAKFFQRKKGDKLGDGVADDDFYGIAYQMGKPYDFSSVHSNGFIWEAGGDIWDETSTKPALGVVNSDNAVKAFDHYLSLENICRRSPRLGRWTSSSSRISTCRAKWPRSSTGSA